MSPLQSLIATGTKLYVDSVDPAEVDQALKDGAVGATSNPVIIGGIIAKGGFDDEIQRLVGEGESDSEIAWALCDKLVSDAQEKFLPVWESTGGEAGWVSFELDPLLEDTVDSIPEADRTSKYVELGKRYAEGHKNRMIKVPGTPGGIGALEELAAAGVTLNVTLLFTDDQYRAARDAVWKGAQRRESTDGFKSVYSIFISRIDVYTDKQLDLSDDAQGRVGLLNAKRIWRENCDFWASKKLPLSQEMIFASTGAKLKGDPEDKYVSALAGSDIQTNPPRHQRRDPGDVRQDLHPHRRPAPPPAGAGRDRREGRRGRDARVFDGGGPAEVRGPAKGPHQADRRKAGGVDVARSGRRAVGVSPPCDCRSTLVCTEG